MRIALIWTGSVALAALAAGCAALVLPACEIALPFGSYHLGICPGLHAGRKPSGGQPARDALQAEIRSLERALAGQNCRPVAAPEPEPVPVPAAEPEPPPEPPPVIDQSMLDKADLSDLRGCWVLDSPYRTQNGVTGEVTEFSDWTVCFDAAGNGHETMQGSNGISCAGPVTGSFVPGQALVIEEADDLPCSDDMAILKRRVTCSVDQGQRASCESFQPEGGSRVDVIMRRSQEAP